MNLSTSQFQSIYEDLELTAEYFNWRIGLEDSSHGIDEFITEYIQKNLFDEYYSEKQLALMLATTLEYSEASSAIDNEEYLVLTESEADETCFDYATSYVENVVSGEIPSNYMQYFNTGKFIDDFLSNSSRGEILASYDEIELYETVNDTTYYIYKC